MKKSIHVLAMCIAIACFVCSSGCALFGVASLSPEKPGYEEGRIAAFTYVASEKAQPEELNAAIRAGYVVIKGLVLDGHDPVRSVVEAEVESLYPDTTPEFRALIVNFYDMGRTRLDGVLENQTNIPTPTVLKNFIDGIESGLMDWKPGYAEG